MEIRELDSALMHPRIMICRLFDTGTAVGWKPMKRVSEYYELVYYTGGNGSVFINGEEKRISAGDVRFTKPGTELYGLPYYSSYSILFDFGQPRVLYRNPILDGICDYFHAGPELSRYFEKMIQLFHSPSLTAAVNLNSMLLSVFGMLYDGLHTGKTILPAVRACLHYMENNFSKQISLDTLCPIAGYSKPHLLRIFKQELGCSPHDYLTTVRINNAKLRLTESDLPLSAISLECGFSSDSHFKTLFKKETGLTPGRYRNAGLMSEPIDAEE